MRGGIATTITPSSNDFKSIMARGRSDAAVGDAGRKATSITYRNH